MNPISEREYRSFLKEIERLIALDPSEDSNEGERLKLISIAVEAYEKSRFHFGKPSPIEAIKFRMEEMGLAQADIAPYLGGKNRASEILSKKRAMTLPMVKALHKYLGIPLDILLQDESEREISFAPDRISF